MKIKSDFFPVTEDKSSKGKFLNNGKSFYFQHLDLRLKIEFLRLKIEFLGPRLSFWVHLQDPEIL